MNESSTTTSSHLYTTLDCYPISWAKTSIALRVDWHVPGRHHFFKKSRHIASTQNNVVIGIVEAYLHRQKKDFTILNT